MPMFPMYRAWSRKRRGCVRTGFDWWRHVQRRCSMSVDTMPRKAMLSPLVEGDLFRERLWSLLALALYRCDRQAEGLGTLRRLRGNLVEELGVDPSPSIRALEEDVLAQAPHLDAPVERSSTRPTGAGDATRSRASGVVGRSQALGMIDGAVSRLVESGSGTTILLTGEPGIGKSTLAAELGRRAGARGALVLVGRSHEADLAPAFWPWLPVLRSLADESAPPEVKRLLGSGADVLEVVSAGSGCTPHLRLGQPGARRGGASTGGGARGPAFGRYVVSCGC